MKLTDVLIMCHSKLKCWFFQKGECILHSWWWCRVCPWHIRKIEGIDDPKSYIDLVTGKRLASRSLTIAIITITIALLSLLISLKKSGT